MCEAGLSLLRTTSCSLDLLERQTAPGWDPVLGHLHDIIHVCYQVSSMAICKGIVNMHSAMCQLEVYVLAFAVCLWK